MRKLFITGLVVLSVLSSTLTAVAAGSGKQKNAETCTKNEACVNAETCTKNEACVNAEACMNNKGCANRANCVSQGKRVSDATCVQKQICRNACKNR